jgi:hypothetical protein
MKLALVAVVSFAIGAAGTLLVNPGHEVFAQKSALNNGFMPIVPPLGSASPVPLIPGLSGTNFSHNTIVADPNATRPIVVNLDGLVQTNNVWDNERGVAFVYGGGAYKLSSNAIVGPISLVLTGAAANTAALLEQFGFLAKNDPATVTPAATDPSKPKNKPSVHKTTIPTPFKGDISSQFDGTPQ